MNDMPLIESLDELLTREELAAYFRVKPKTVSDYMYRDGMPYLRVQKRLYFSKRQIGWWLNSVQQRALTERADVTRARRATGAA